MNKAVAGPNILLVYPRTKEKLIGGVSCPLGIQYLASFLRNNGASVEIADMTFAGLDGCRDALSRIKPDFVGFSMQTPIAKDGFEAISMTRKMLPDAKIIVGGAHPTVADISGNKNIDFIVKGEGELSMLKIVQGNEKQRVIAGEPISDLDDLPFPDRDMNIPYIEKNREIELMVSRGCPYNCMFCQPTQRRLFGSSVRMRTPNNVIWEIRTLIARFGKDNLFYFLDDTFTWNPAWLKDFCRLAKPLNIRWKCSTRVNLIDGDKLAMMKDAGCVFINYGVESGSQRILDFMRKGITVRQIEKAFEQTHKAGILCHAFIIVGTPTETKNDLDATLELVKKIHPDGLQISIMTPMPGTDMEKYCKEKGILNISDSDEYNYCMNSYPIKLKHLTEDDLKTTKDKLMKTWSMFRLKNVWKYLNNIWVFFFLFRISIKRNGVRL